MSATINLSTGPPGTASLNSGAAYTRTSSVTGRFTLAAGMPAADLCVKVNADISTCTTRNWVAASPGATVTQTLKLGSTQGLKTVQAAWRVRATKEAISAPAVATIVLDSTAPTDGPTLTAVAAGPTGASLGWTASRARDAQSGIAKFVITYSLSTPPSRCTTRSGVTSVPLAHDASLSSAAVSGLVTGKTYKWVAGEQGAGAGLVVLGCTACGG